MAFEGITPEMYEDARGKSPEELLKLADEAGMELTDEQVDQIAGGVAWDPPNVFKDGCPKCGSKDISYGNVGQIMWYTCRKCGHKWC